MSALALAVFQVAVVAVAVPIGGEIVLDHDHRVVVLKDQICDVLRVSADRGVDLLEHQVRRGREWPASYEVSVHGAAVHAVSVHGASVHEASVQEVSVHLFEASVHLFDENAQERVSEMVISLGFQ